MSTRTLDDREAQLVGQAALFRELPAAAQEEVTRAARKLVLRKGQVLFRQGEPADAVWLVLSGRLRISQDSSQGQTVSLRVIGPGELVGLVAALGERTFPVTAQAQQVSTLARWSGDELWHFIERFPVISVAALRMVLKRLQDLQEQHRELATERVERRIARALLRLVRQTGRRVEQGVRIDMPLTRQDLAEMTGTTLFTVSRVLTAWADRGILESRRSQVTVLRPHGLVSIAEDLSPGDEPSAD